MPARGDSQASSGSGNGGGSNHRARPSTTNETLPIRTSRPTSTGGNAAPRITSDSARGSGTSEQSVRRSNLAPAAPVQSPAPARGSRTAEQSSRHSNPAPPGPAAPVIKLSPAEAAKKRPTSSTTTTTSGLAPAAPARGSGSTAEQGGRHSNPAEVAKKRPTSSTTTTTSGLPPAAPVTRQRSTADPSSSSTTTQTSTEDWGGNLYLAQFLDAQNIKLDNYRDLERFHDIKDFPASQLNSLRLHPAQAIKDIIRDELMRNKKSSTDIGQILRTPQFNGNIPLDAKPVMESTTGLILGGIMDSIDIVQMQQLAKQAKAEKFAVLTIHPNDFVVGDGRGGPKHTDSELGWWMHGKSEFIRTQDPMGRPLVRQKTLKEPSIVRVKTGEKLEEIKSLVENHMIIDLQDNADAPLLESLPKGVRFVRDHLRMNTPEKKTWLVMVHCKMGQSRSSAFIVAYLMDKYYREKLRNVNKRDLSDDQKIQKLKDLCDGLMPALKQGRAGVKFDNFEEHLKDYAEILVRNQVAPKPPGQPKGKGKVGGAGALKEAALVEFVKLGQKPPEYLIAHWESKMKAKNTHSKEMLEMCRCAGILGYNRWMGR